MSSHTTELMARPLEVLLAEDNPGDIRLTREAFKRGKLRINLSVASNGEEAMAFLRRRGTYTEAVRPDLFLLDLNMPRKDGRSVLAEIKNDPALNTIPVIVFSGSESGEDILKCYKLRANSYVSKPLELDRFNEVVRSIENFWLATAKLPEPEPRPDTEK